MEVRERGGFAKELRLTRSLLVARRNPSFVPRPVDMTQGPTKTDRRVRWLVATVWISRKPEKLI